MTDVLLDFSNSVPISTHTLTWSVTGGLLVSAAVSSISTHTLTWSVTCNTDKGNDDWLISTHTLTWSVTVFHMVCHYGHSNFNSHAHVERDLAAVLLHFQRFHFNSHAHVERDNIYCYILPEV